MHYRVTVHSVSSQVYEMKCLCDCRYFNGQNCEAKLELIGECPWKYVREETVEVYVEGSDNEENWNEAALAAENWLFLHRWSTDRQIVFVELYEVTTTMQMEENGAEPLFDMAGVF